MTYHTHADADDRVRSAITAAEAILGLDLYPAHKRTPFSVRLEDQRGCSDVEVSNALPVSGESFSAGMRTCA
jgi:hypothetical protein